MDQTDTSVWLDMSLDDIAKLRKEKQGGGAGKTKKAPPSEAKPKPAGAPAAKPDVHPSLLGKICSNCLKPGHLRKDCTSARACSVCGNTEHTKAECPKAGQGQACSGCGSTSHLKKVCPHAAKTCDNCKKVGHLKAVCKQLPVAARVAVSAAVGKVVPPVSDAKPAGAVKACFVCGSVAHEKKNCPHKFQMCEACGKQGHFTALCPQQQKKAATTEKA